MGTSYQVLVKVVEIVQLQVGELVARYLCSVSRRNAVTAGVNVDESRHP